MAPRAAGSAALCGTSAADLAPGGAILRVVLNAGDTSTTGEGIEGGFDNVVITGGGNTVTYDFEPAEVTACDAAPLPGRVGTAGNDAVRGTAAGERIDLLAGNDSADALGGDDCVLGGAGKDNLRAGDGADEILGGSEADVIDAGNGADTIDLGAGRDIVSADAGDDRISAKDGEFDIIDCGPGTDT